MHPSGYNLRRATIDDLAALMVAWEAMHYPTTDLERRLTEFQLVESSDGHFLGALGMEVSERHGRVYGEAFTDFSLADQLRELLWVRLQSLATNLGLARIWTSESAPFWKRNGLHPADPNELKKLPAGWASLPGEWLTVQLRDEEALRVSLETDFNRLLVGEKQNTERMLQRARIGKYIGVAISIGVAIVAIVFCIYLLQHSQNFLHR